MGDGFCAAVGKRLHACGILVRANRGAAQLGIEVHRPTDMINHSSSSAPADRT